MELPIFQVDAFTGHLFGGNPAAVVILSQWLPNEILQAIAAENNLADTAFVVPLRGEFGLRWFTPKVEVDLCGHATLASAHVLFRHGYAAPPDIISDYGIGNSAAEKLSQRCRDVDNRKIESFTVHRFTSRPSKNKWRSILD
jgi:predicted PhzF superfamily epimerase YddE/YHI9